MTRSLRIVNAREAKKERGFLIMAVMSVVIRMARQGTKKKPVFAIVAMNKSDKRDGRSLERLGQYFPKAKTVKEKLIVDRQKVAAWVAKGAQISQTVGQLLRSPSK